MSGYMLSLWRATYLSYIKGRFYIELLTACYQNRYSIFERSACMPKHPPINYPPLDRLLHKTSKNRICILVLSHIQNFLLIPRVLSSPATFTEYTGHFLKTTFPDSCGTSKREDSSKSQQQFFSRWKYIPYRESKSDNFNSLRNSSQRKASNQESRHPWPTFYKKKRYLRTHFSGNR